MSAVLNDMLHQDAFVCSVYIIYSKLCVGILCKFGFHNLFYVLKFHKLVTCLVMIHCEVINLSEGIENYISIHF